MAFCMNCGNEVPDGTKFCPNCGTQVGSSVPPEKAKEAQNVQQQNREPVSYQQPQYSAQPPVQQPQPSGLDKFGKFLGIILFILAILDFNSDPAILTIILSAGIIAGAIYCLGKKYKLKGFTIIALILAVICLFSGVGQAKKFGLFKTPTAEEYASSSTATKENLVTVKEEKKADDTITKSEVKEEPKEEITTTEADKASPEEKTEEKTEEQPQETEKASGVDPDLKAFLDSYEEFIDQYVEFMKKYNSDPNNMVSMLGEYGEMMQKYAEFADKVDKYNSDDMSTEDYKYYIEVTTRCTQKMLEAY